MHRPHGRLVLRDDRFEAAPALVYVAIQTADEAYVGVAIDKDFHVHQAAHLRVEEDEDAFDDDNRARLDVNRFGLARMRGVVVGRLLDALAGAQGFEMIRHQIDVDGVGVIEVDFVPQLKRHIAEVAIVSVLLQINHIAGADRSDDLLRNRRLAGTRAATYANDHKKHSNMLTGRYAERRKGERAKGRK